MITNKTWLICQFAVIFIVLISVPLYAFAQSTESGGYADYTPDEPELVASNEGYWIINASSAGPDVPNVGHSLFDLIFSTFQSGHSDYQIPYPFSALIQRLRNHLDPSEESVKKVRIPIGRSLRRESAAPDYFHSPRIVIAADAEPIEVQGQAGLNLKGRLFLGYQESAEILEIISYNPEAGRFEFQEVRNYGVGLKPKVTYANRPLCLSCHQNAGPIFPKEPWLETDSNLQVSAQLPMLPSKTKIDRSPAR